MKVLFLRGVGTLALFSLLGSMLSCAHDQQLVSVSVTPGEEIIGDANTPVIFDAGASVQLRALGHYIHPQVTKDITNQVTWGSDDIQMVTVNPTGLVMATGNACGATLISATVNTNSSAGNRTSKGAIVTGYMTTDVTCFTGTGNTLTVQFSGTGTGIVGSSHGGLGCSRTATSCSGAFPPGSIVTLTATPTGSSVFGGWAGCTSTSGTTCTIDLINGNATVAVAFN